MKRALKELKGYIISAKDGTKGTANDFLIDEESWTIRYMVADLGKILPGKKVLIPRNFLIDSDWEKGHFNVDLTKDEIKGSPGLEEDLPVSRAYEALLHEHYGIEQYWPLAYGGVMTPTGMLRPPVPVEVTRDIVKEEDVDTSLRSFNEILGYHVECLDKKKGHVKNVVIDDETWQVIYLIVDISPWYKMSKKVMVAVNWINSINYPDQKIKINLESASLEEAPVFDPGEPVNKAYEKQLYDYYGRKSVEV